MVLDLALRSMNKVGSVQSGLQTLKLVQKQEQEALNFERRGGTVEVWMEQSH